MSPGREVTITVEPTCIRRIRGISDLRRETYFALSDPGRDFERRCRSEERYEYLIHENRITFGRKLGVVQPLMRWSRVVREDPNRPGFADVEFLKRTLTKRGHSCSSERFRRDVGGRLEVAAHERHNAFPEFMGKYMTAQAAREGEWIPQNIEAAAELTAAALKYDYCDFCRPAFYEPVNEPHWSYVGDEHFWRWHLKTMQAVHRLTPEVKVGGPCLSVAYFYGEGFKAFNGLKSFIDGTQCRLDFYSFHVYDYLSEVNGDFGGRITSGLPLEAVLDLVANYTVNAYEKEVKVVVSEHGGYGADDLVERLARSFFPGGGFEWEMKKRSIEDFNMVSSALANTLVFMDHPHIVIKAVPFILLESMGWDPRYYAVLYVPYGFTDKSRWVPTQKILFYRFFRDVEGHRVKAFCTDPDLQVRAFVNGKAVLIIVNNLSTKPHTVSLNLPPGAQLLTRRRLGRNEDFTPYLVEEPLDRLSNLTIRGREAWLVRAEYPKAISSEHVVDEIPCYGDRVAFPVEGEAIVHISVPSGRLEYAVLRIGVSRPTGSDYRIRVRFNGHELDVPLEDCAQRLDYGKQGYGSCKIVPVPVKWVRERNRVAISFPDGKPGSVGAVVLRVGVLREKRERGGER